MHRSTPTRALALVAFAVLAQAQDVGSVQRVSLTYLNASVNAAASRPAISADGRYVAFQTIANNVVFGDTNDADDVFVYDRGTGTIQRVSVNSAGAQAPQGGTEAALSGDGRFVAFTSSASNLAPNDQNNVADVFLRDLVLGTTERVSVGTGGYEGNSSSGKAVLSFDGRFVAFESRSTNFDLTDMSFDTDVFVRDRLLDTTTRVSADALGNGNAATPSLSSDGRFVAFASVIALDPADTNNKIDVYVRDTSTNALYPVSATPTVFGNDDSTAPSISADGSRVAFASRSTNLAGSTAAHAQVFLKDFTAGTLAIVSRTSTGVLADADCSTPSVSSDGEQVVFTSLAHNLAPLTPAVAKNVFARNLSAATTVPISATDGGVLANAASDTGVAAADGLVVAFVSIATNLIPQDTSPIQDIFVAGRSATPTYRSFCYTGNATFCPCSNQGLTGRGCGHSISADGALLRAAGAATVQGDTVLLEAFNLVPGASLLFFQGTLRVNSGMGSTFGDGLRCAGGTVVRLAVRIAGGAGYAALGAAITGDPLISVQGAVPAGGGVRTYQAWYRNAVAFCTPALYNTTNGIEITWQP
jgi:Tol biopolymer transport system component